MLASQALRHRANWAHLHPVGRLPQTQHLINDGRRVLSRGGVRHGVNGRVASDGRRARPGENRFGILSARLTQVRVHVDEAGQGDETCCVNDAWVGQSA